MFFLIASLMPVKNDGSKPLSYQSYFWDYAPELTLQCILNQTLWINNQEIEGPQKLGNYIQILQVFPDSIKVKIHNRILKLSVGQKVKVR